MRIDPLEINNRISRAPRFVNLMAVNLRRGEPSDLVVRSLTGGFTFFFFERFRSSYFVNVSLFSFPSVRSRPLISPISRRSMHDTSRPERSRTLRREMKKKEPNKNDVERKHVVRLVEQRTTSTRKYPVSSRETVAINFNGWKSDNDPKQCHYKPRKPFLTASKLR